MPLFLDTRGRSTLGIGICGRCKEKFSLDDLYSDPNTPGLRVCRDDLDQYDPWRLPPPPPDRITLDNPRPDRPLFPFGPSYLPVNAVPGLRKTYPSYVWTNGTPYQRGATVTPVNVNDTRYNTPIPEFVALNDGRSGDFTPEWPTETGVTVMDGTVEWLCLGVSLLDTNEPAVGPVMPGNP